MARINQSATGWSFIQGDLTPEGFIRGAAKLAWQRLNWSISNIGPL